MWFCLKNLITVCGLFVIQQINAQIEDENTLLINTYFNLSSTHYFDSYKPLKTISSEALYILQYGNSNYIDINSSGKSEQKINQIGNYNNFQFIDYYNTTEMSLDIFQGGNNSSIQIFGTNTLMKDLIIKQRAHDKTLIINNF